jgi:hypothetical protein
MQVQKLYAMLQWRTTAHMHNIGSSCSAVLHVYILLLQLPPPQQHDEADRPPLRMLWLLLHQYTA